MFTVLVTVDTPHASLDLELPAEIPLREVLPALLEVCGLPQATESVTPEAWALGLAESGPLPPSQTLLESAIVDGARLLLQDGLSWRRPRLPGALADVAPPDMVAGGIAVRWRRDDLLPSS
jgi:hypothetical protein